MSDAVIYALGGGILLGILISCLVAKLCMENKSELSLQAGHDYLISAQRIVEKREWCDPEPTVDNEFAQRCIGKPGFQIVSRR